MHRPHIANRQRAGRNYSKLTRKRKEEQGKVSKRFLKRQEKFTDYAGFVEKFETKKTTDDCYTPANVYEVVANYVAETYGVDRVDMVRPF